MAVAIGRETIDSRGLPIGYDRPYSPGLGVARWAVAPGNDYYRILQVDPSEHDDVIQAAYRRLALRYHPDRNPSAEAARMMARINVAYEVLSSPARRAEYDRSRKTPPRESPASAPTKARVPSRPSRKTVRGFLKRLIAIGRPLAGLFLMSVLIWLLPELLLAAICLSIAAAPFYFRLAFRNYVLAVLLVAGFLVLTARNIGYAIYSAGIIALNAVFDPATRGFWPDPAHPRLGSYEGPGSPRGCARLLGDRLLAEER